VRAVSHDLIENFIQPAYPAVLALDSAELHYRSIPCWPYNPVTVRSIAHVSDIHFDRVDPTVADELVRDITAKKPDLVIVSGDLTQRARVGQFRRAMEFLERLPKPQIRMAGNHDVPLYNLFRRLFNPLGRFKQNVTSDLMPIFQDEELLVVGLNTAGRGSLRPNGYWKDGHISRKELADAIHLLRAAPSELVRIVVTHHPFVAHDEAHRGDVVRNGQGVIERLNGLNVHLLLAGHLHHAFHAEVECGAISVQAGTACSSRRRGQPNSYNWITVDGFATTVQVRISDGGPFAAAAEHRFERPEKSRC